MQTVDGKTGLESFFSWLAPRTTLIAHNAPFHSTLLVSKCKVFGLIHLLEEKVHQFGNTLPIFKKKYPDLENHKLLYLVEKLLPKTNKPDNARTEVLALVQLLKKIDMNSLEKHTTSTAHAIETFQRLENRKENLSSYDGAIMRKIIPKCTARRLAERGHSFPHLRRIYRRMGKDTTSDLVKQCGARQSTIEKLCDFLSLA